MILLGEQEKEYFRGLMHRQAGFAGIEIVTYALLDNHFHILAYVPEAEEVSDADLLQRGGLLGDKLQVAELEQRLGWNGLKRMSRPRHTRRNDRNIWIGCTIWGSL